VTVRLGRVYRSAEEALAVWRAVAADNPPYIAGGTDGPRLWIEVRSDRPASLRMTLDDLIAGLAAAERASEVAGGPAGSRPAKAPARS
jgi:hypothetical protein